MRSVPSGRPTALTSSLSSDKVRGVAWATELKRGVRLFPVVADWSGTFCGSANVTSMVKVLLSGVTPGGACWDGFTVVLKLNDLILRARSVGVQNMSAGATGFPLP